MLFRNDAFAQNCVKITFTHETHIRYIEPHHSSRKIVGIYLNLSILKIQYEELYMKQFRSKSSYRIQVTKLFCLFAILLDKISRAFSRVKKLTMMKCDISRVVFIPTTISRKCYLCFLLFRQYQQGIIINDVNFHVAFLFEKVYSVCQKIK